MTDFCIGIETNKPQKIITNIPLLNEILLPWKNILKDDFNGYKEHVLRLINFVYFIADLDEPTKMKLIIIAAFHDLGLWCHTKNTNDKSILLVTEYLNNKLLSNWTEEATLIISKHKKLIKPKNEHDSLCDVFRQAYLVDCSKGLFHSGISNDYIKTVFEVFPDTTHHKKIGKETLNDIKNNFFGFMK